MNRYMIEEEEVQRFGHIWREQCAQRAPELKSDGVAMPTSWVVAQILALSDECPNRSAVELAPMIHRILSDSCYACDGDIVTEPSPEAMKRQVGMVVATIEEWRRVLA